MVLLLDHLRGLLAVNNSVRRISKPEQPRVALVFVFLGMICEGERLDLSRHRDGALIRRRGRPRYRAFSRNDLGRQIASVLTF